MEMATNSSILAWRIPWTEEPSGLLSMGSHRVEHDWSDLACMHAFEKEMATHSSILAWRIPGTEEPWWAAVYGIAQSRTRLKWLSSSSSSSSGLRCYLYNMLNFHKLWALFQGFLFCFIGLSIHAPLCAVFYFWRLYVSGRARFSSRTLFFHTGFPNFYCMSVFSTWTIVSVCLAPGKKVIFIMITFCCSVTQLCLTLCSPMDCSMRGSPVFHYLNTEC